MTKPTQSIVIGEKETIAVSWARDASTLVLFVALIGIGVFLESSAMQWMGAVVAFVCIFAKSTVKTMTLDEAKAHIDAMIAERERTNDQG